MEKKQPAISVSSGEPEKEYALPQKRHRSRVLRYLDRKSELHEKQQNNNRDSDTFFSYYRKIFSVVFMANFVTFITLIATYGLGPRLTSATLIAVSTNLMIALLFRQENFVNLLYEIFVHVPHAAPLWLRMRCAKVFHYGGAHSGCGVAAVVWHLLYTSLSTKDFIDSPGKENVPPLVTSWILVTMFVAIISAAHPHIRKQYHDRFEYTHRFAGWVALTTFWTQLILYANAQTKHSNHTLGGQLARSVNFWFLIISTSCSLLSWSRLRPRKVIPERLSDHAIRLHFDYKAMEPFYGLKVSTRPLYEWHAFATIPDRDATGKTTGFSIVVSNAGDWTSSTIMKPPDRLWIRGYPLHGLLYTSKLFKKIVVVATGSGIGPTLSLMAADVTPRRVLWSTPNPEITYGKGIIDTVLRADPNAVIWNTRTQGRPDMVAITYRLFRESDAEAVFIISNPKLTRKVVYGMESRGIAAYGAIFDS